MDAWMYLAHMDQQARSLPNVLVAPIRPSLVAAAALAAVVATATNNVGNILNAHECGLLSTMWVFLSVRFDILPPLLTRHLPPGVASGVGGGDDDGSCIHTWVGGTISNFSNL
jgi:hypothetical protein